MNKKLYIETYGCQMNFSDSEIIASVMERHEYELTKDMQQADVILVNTCAIRENAERRVMGRIQEYKQVKRKNPSTIIGVVGCMAERLKADLLKTQKEVDLIAGPDSYRHLPDMLENIQNSHQQVANVILSKEETYEDIQPVRLDGKGVSAFISIMRGCDNYCSYCVVPYTRGRERSRNPKTILKEVQDLYHQGYREITLLGQNVNSYLWENSQQKFDFPDLLKQTARLQPDMRIRFATSNPKDLSDKLIETISSTENIATAIHLPVQSGSTTVLKRMNRKYTREWYLNRIRAIKAEIPDAGITTDIIAGFCEETEAEHQDTLSLMTEVGYDFAFMFIYSERPGTLAAKRFQDNVPEAIKTRRLQEIIKLQQKLSQQSNQRDLNKTFTVLVEGPSKKDPHKMMGRNPQNKVIVFPATKNIIGQYTKVKVTDFTSATLLGTVVT